MTRLLLPDPLALQAMFARAMLAADPVTSGVCYVHDHFVRYTGAKPVGKGWNNKRCRALKRSLTLQAPCRITRALTLLLDEINHNPPIMPGNTRPITYQLSAQPAEFNN